MFVGFRKKFFHLITGHLIVICYETYKRKKILGLSHYNLKVMTIQIIIVDFKFL